MALSSLYRFCFATVFCFTVQGCGVEFEAEQVMPSTLDPQEAFLDQVKSTKIDNLTSIPQSQAHAGQSRRDSSPLGIKCPKGMYECWDCYYNVAFCAKIGTCDGTQCRD